VRFVAIDGEADSDGNYIVMCDSEGRVLYNPQGISSSEALEFLLALPRSCEVVCYGLNYDVNQWIKDLPRATLERLAEYNQCSWRGCYRLQWIPSKMFTVTTPEKSVTVCEVFGFFQTSFVSALQNWGIPPPVELQAMKRKRGSFTQKELARVVAYCQQECRLLVQMMDKLYTACCDADCIPRRRWIGAGSIASALMTKHHIRQHHVHDVDLFGQAVTEDYILRGYYGGRVELYQQGWTKACAVYDIRSAYPSAALALPSLTRATWEHTCTWQPDRLGLWRVSWDINNYNGHVAPFPVRLSSSRICYPLSGDGVYHTVEVRAALECGYPIKVHDGIVLSTSLELPFSWIQDVYAHRVRMQKQGNYGEKALKLGLNSIYGKCAQGYGFGNRPPFQSYFWAGLITSTTRAKMLRLLTEATHPVMIATDGLVCENRHMTSTTSWQTGIGSWERSLYDRVATIQPGVYVAEYNGTRHVKSRGFFARDVDYDVMLDYFQHDRMSCYHYKSRRFIGLKVALHRKDFSVWRQWINEPRTVSFEVQHKRAVNDGKRTLLYPLKGPYSSIAYAPKQSLYDDPTDDTLENMIRDDQPHREVD
jgi:DNA polymerase type B, organellar and viral